MLRYLCLAALAAGLAQAQSPSPASSPSPSPSPAARVEEIPEAYRRVLAMLKGRAEEPLPAKEILFGRISAPDWASLRVREIKQTPRGLVLVLENDPKEYTIGAIVQGRRLSNLTLEEATFEQGGEQRRIKLRRAAPTLQVRAIKQVEGEWAAFMEGERRPLYPGDVVKAARIVKIEADGVTFQIGAEMKKFSPKVEKKPFPALAFNGIIDMGTGRVVLIKGRPDPVKVGDVVEGAKILAITPSAVNVEYDGVQKAFPPK